MESNFRAIDIDILCNFGLNSNNDFRSKSLVGLEFEIMARTRYRVKLKITISRLKFNISNKP